MAISGRVRTTPRKHELRRFWRALACLMRGRTSLDRLTRERAWVMSESAGHLLEVVRRGCVLVRLHGVVRGYEVRAMGPGWPDELARKLEGELLVSGWEA